MVECSNHCILICATCKGPQEAKRIRSALLHYLPEGYILRAVDCMAGCDRPVTIGFQAAGKAQYLFGDIDTATDVEALAQFAQQYQASDTGWTNSTERPKGLRSKTMARMPRLRLEDCA